MQVQEPRRQGSGSRRYDAVVVGCGAMGSSVSYNLAKRGLKVLTFERFQLNHVFGSSHGGTRIIRMAYFEDPRYVPLLRRAFESWRETQRRYGKKLLDVTGGLMVGRPEGELVTGVLRSAKEHSIPCRTLSAGDIASEYDAFTVDEEMCAVKEEEAGVLYAEECVRAYATLADQEGCEVRFGEAVRSWRDDGEKVVVETGNGRYEADRVVFCAGPWNAGLLGGAIPVVCERQVPMWFSPGTESCYALGKMPVFMCEEVDGRLFYGLPDVGQGVKVARTHGGETVDPDSVRREVTEEDISPVVAFVKERMRKLKVPPIASTTCIYSNTPDLNFIVAKHPKTPRGTIVSACSGHGFKFASVLGEVAADLSLEGKTKYDIGFLGLERFAKGS